MKNLLCSLSALIFFIPIASTSATIDPAPGVYSFSGSIMGCPVTLDLDIQYAGPDISLTVISGNLSGSGVCALGGLILPWHATVPAASLPSPPTQTFFVDFYDVEFYMGFLTCSATGPVMVEARNGIPISQPTSITISGSIGMCAISTSSLSTPPLSDVNIY